MFTANIYIFLLWIDLDVDDVNSVVAFCTTRQVSLVVIGPEVPLSNGLVDQINASCPSIACFGPTQAAAMLEVPLFCVGVEKCLLFSDQQSLLKEFHAEA
jgi:hypothetical protein